MVDERRDAILTGEARVEAAVVKAMRLLAKESVKALEQSGYDPAVLDTRWPVWQQIVDDVIMPVIAGVYTTSYDRTATGLQPLTSALVPPGRAPLVAAVSTSAMANATDHLATVNNRMVGIGDDVFRLITDSLDEGRLEGEAIPKLAKRVDATLKEQGAATWRNRGTTVARTEVIGAHNAGAHAAAYKTMSQLGREDWEVVKEWHTTLDGRERESHAALDGAQVMGMDTLFDNGLLYPGDPGGDAGEVINCRCTCDYLQPGDPGYPQADVWGDTPAEPDPEPTFDYKSSIASYMQEGMTKGAANARADQDYWAYLDEHKEWKKRNWDTITADAYGGAQVQERLLGNTRNAFIGANPGFITGKEGFGINCQNCVTAFDMRMRGYDVTALPNAGKYAIKGNPYLTRWLDTETGAVTLMDRAKFVDAPLGGVYRHNNLVDAVDRAATTGQQQWGIVYTQWRRGDAHVFNWVKDSDGLVKFVEPQTGHLYGPNHAMWAQMKPDSVFVVRTDDLARPSGEGVRFNKR